MNLKRWVGFNCFYLAKNTQGNFRVSVFVPIWGEAAQFQVFAIFVVSRAVAVKLKSLRIN